MAVGPRSSPRPVHDKEPKHPRGLDVVRAQVARLGMMFKLRAESLVEDGAEAVLLGVPDPYPLAAADTKEYLKRCERDAKRAVTGIFPVDNAGDAARRVIDLYVHLHQVRVVQHLREFPPEDNGQPRPQLSELGLEPRGEGSLPRG